METTEHDGKVKDFDAFEEDDAEGATNQDTDIKINQQVLWRCVEGKCFCAGGSACFMHRQTMPTLKDKLDRLLRASHRLEAIHNK